MTTQDHERIWLQHPDDPGLSEGRCWCQDKVWPDGPDDGEPTEYIRRDLFDAVTKDRIESEIKRLKVQNHLARVTKLLKAIVSDVRGMGYSLKANELEEDEFDSGHWFGPFSDAVDAIGSKDSDLKIEWPNLAISVGEAEVLLKEIDS